MHNFKLTQVYKEYSYNSIRKLFILYIKERARYNPALT